MKQTLKHQWLGFWHDVAMNAWYQATEVERRFKLPPLASNRLYRVSLWVEWHLLSYLMPETEFFIGKRGVYCLSEARTGDRDGEEQKR
jgi:hypothetical protein